MKLNNDYAVIVKGKIENFLNKQGLTEVEEYGMLDLIGGVVLVFVGCGIVTMFTLVALELADYLN